MKESVENNFKRNSRGDIAFNKKDLSEAFYHYVRGNNIEGLYNVAKELSAKGREKEAANVLMKAYELKELDK